LNIEMASRFCRYADLQEVNPRKFYATHAK
jgi:hypothetical protein